MNDGPVSPSSEVNNRYDNPTWGPASPTPFAAYIVSVISSTRRRSARSKRSTGFDGSRSTGSPRTRIGIATRGILQVGFGLDARHDAGAGELARQRSERGNGGPIERDET